MVSRVVNHVFSWFKWFSLDPNSSYAHRSNATPCSTRLSTSLWIAVQVWHPKWSGWSGVKMSCWEAQVCRFYVGGISALQKIIATLWFLICFSFHNMWDGWLTHIFIAVETANQIELCNWPLCHFKHEEGVCCTARLDATDVLQRDPVWRVGAEVKESFLTIETFP